MKTSNLFNIDSLNTMTAGEKLQQNDEGILLSRHLTFINPRILTKQFPDTVFKQMNLPVDNSGGYADNILSLRTQVQGSFGDYGGASGKISIEADSTTLPVYSRDALIEWSFLELKQAEEQGINILDKLMEGTLRIYDQTLDDAALLGVKDNKGLTNNTHYTSQAANAVFSGLTARQKYDEIARAVEAQWNQVNNTSAYIADCIVMPTAIYNDIAVTVLNEFNKNSILKVLNENLPSVKIMHTPKLTDKMVVFSKSIDSLAYRIPLPMTFSPIYQRHFKFETNAVYRIGGIDILEPTSGYILTGMA